MKTSDLTSARTHDLDLLRVHGSRLRDSTGADVVFAGLREGRGVRIAVTIGQRTTALRTIYVTPHRGLGGLIWPNRKPIILRDYGSATFITHDFDPQILGEGIRCLGASPIVVDGDVRGLLYAGSRESRPLEAGVVDRLAEHADTIARELGIRDEVDRRVAATTMSELPELATGMPAAVKRKLATIADECTDASTALRIRRLVQEDNETPSILVELTPRQLQVLGLIRLGLTNKAIANRLGLKPESVKTYLRAAMTRLGATTRHEAVLKARRAGHAF